MSHSRTLSVSQKYKEKGSSGSTRVSDNLHSTSYILDISNTNNLLWPRATFSKVPVVNCSEKLFFVGPVYLCDRDIKSFEIQTINIPRNGTEWRDFLAKTRTTIP